MVQVEADHLGERPHVASCCCATTVGTTVGTRFALVCRAKDGDDVEIHESTLLEAGLLNVLGNAMRAGVAIERWGDFELGELETD